MFFCIGAFFMISQNNLALNESENADIFISNYKGWLSNIFGNLGTLTGSVIDMKWLPA